jgi:UDP-N-acetylglucosamine 2-epimerase (non-hydrolysing)
MSTGISAIAAKLTGKKGCHVEAGLRSYNIFEPFPEELMRILADNLSSLKFAPSEIAVKRAGHNSFNVGNTSCESLRYALKKAQNVKKSKKKYAVCTIHRHENIKSPVRMMQIAEIIALSPYPVNFFMHENTKKKLSEYGLLCLFSDYEILNPLGYIDFAPILAGSSLIFTDSGGMSEEAAQLNIPCVILRKSTEREELLHRADQFLTFLDIDKAKSALNAISNLPRNYKFRNIYDAGNTSSKILDILNRKIYK